MEIPSLSSPPVATEHTANLPVWRSSTISDLTSDKKRHTRTAHRVSSLASPFDRISTPPRNSFGSRSLHATLLHATYLDANIFTEHSLTFSSTNSFGRKSCHRAPLRIEHPTPPQSSFGCLKIEDLGSGKVGTREPLT